MTRKFSSDISSLQMAKTDLIEGLKCWEVWLNLAWGDINARYGRTIIGAAWNIVSFSMFCVAIIYFFGLLSRNDQNVFGPHVVVGFLIYSYIANLVIYGCSVFISNNSWMKSMNLPYGIFIYKGITENTIVFAFNLLAALAILLVFFDLKSSIYLWLLIPGFLVILLNSVAMYLLLGVLCARYRDFIHLIQTIMRFALFVTPIMWMASDIGLRGALSLYNPLAHFIDIIRNPILHGDPALHSWMIVLVITLVTWLCAFFVFVGCRKRIIYWL